MARLSHPNGTTAWNGSRAYWDNGTTAWNGSRAYHRNGSSVGSGADGVNLMIGDGIQLFCSKSGVSVLVYGTRVY